jgi:hypothetical protein
MSKLKNHTSEYVKRVDAYKRVALRRWLRRDHGDPETLPTHLYLGWGEGELAREIDARGGDSESIIEQARKEVVGKITMEKGYDQET